jgi:hypothetical protein
MIVWTRSVMGRYVSLDGRWTIRRCRSSSWEVGGPGGFQRAFRTLREARAAVSGALGPEPETTPVPPVVTGTFAEILIAAAAGAGEWPPTCRTIASAQLGAAVARRIGRPLVTMTADGIIVLRAGRTRPWSVQVAAKQKQVRPEPVRAQDLDLLGNPLD